MEDSSMFMQWAMDTLLNEHPEPAIGDGCGETTFPSLQAMRDASLAVEMVRELMADEANAANSWSSGDGDITDDGSTVPAPDATRDCYGSFRRAPPPLPSSSSTNLPVVSWNFVTGSAQPGTGNGGMLEGTAAPRSLPELVHGSPPTKRTSPKSSGAASSASYAPDHIVAERKRREKINKRLIELSTVIPGLKKMDKATILSDAAKYVKELQQRLKALEEAAARRSNETVVLLKKPRNAAVAAPDENGSPSSTTSASSGPPKPALPEIQAWFSEKSAMVRVHCVSGKGVAVTVLAEVEELGLSIVHANVMPFSACTMIITITAKVEEGFTMTAEEVVGRLNSALSHLQHSNCNDTEETGN
ncbi:hypothetical protein SEVIR_3G056400v4 [Setaria viridis]|uniref:BHLH domain-containing protein n=1 Tax=Setaria viridis TaxID=4556 RepID=A0A4V6D941_SETVI|nr:transcription factor bHLH18-like [Setaria viridis]XP_034584846.1 transcription factor bHLH18-like [Setaria viridis]TKW24526.1 hypothetical protein SEVIR_3G056400v2 [Setaria viridis]TKW24527.1 hypothetical protein SEVIR_3G056400v2 [Setaria viridis]